MKKLGTPSTAGPGSANETEGLPEVGTPPAPTLGCLTIREPADEDERDEEWWPRAERDEEERWDWPCPRTRTRTDPPESPGCRPELPEVTVFVGVDGEDDEELDPLPDEEPSGAQDSETFSTASFTGSEIEDRGVPGGTSMTNDR